MVAAVDYSVPSEMFIACGLDDRWRVIQPLFVLMDPSQAWHAMVVKWLTNSRMQFAHSTKSPLHFLKDHHKFLQARVVELVDTLDLGSSSERNGGSNPPFRISGDAAALCGFVRCIRV